MRKIAFVDHSFHRQTQSSAFFLDLLRSRYEVAPLWDDAWQGGKAVSADEIHAAGADVAFFWQSIAPLKELARLKVPIVFAPMYDDVAHKADAYWLRLLGLDLRVLAFCDALRRRTEALGLPTLGVQYYPAPASPSPGGDGPYRVFLWDRGPLSFADVAPYLPAAECAGAVLKLDPDPGLRGTPPTAELRERYRIEVFEGFLPAERYAEIVHGADLYVAPRPLEGIGLSFLEALGRGQAVLGIDSPTLSEYVADDVDGFLLGPRGRAPVKASDVARVRVAARERFARGRARWLAGIEPMLDWIEAPLPPTRPPGGARLAVAAARELAEKAARRARRLMRPR